MNLSPHNIIGGFPKADNPQPVGVVGSPKHGADRPREARIQIPLRGRLNVQRQEGFSIFCLIQCIPFALGWMVVFLDLCVMIWLNFNATEKITVAFHDDWYWEALGLAIEAGYALFIMCAAGGVIASRTSVLPLYYAWICISLCAVTGANLGWMIHEFNHGHSPLYRFWKVSEYKSLTADLKSHFGVSDNKIAPQWMETIQQYVGCCGIQSHEDWYDKFGFLSLPDSCCQYKTEGCGEQFFIRPDGDRPKIYETGCADISPELSGMTYKIFHLLLLVKSVETFLFSLNLVIWLFCLRKQYPLVEIRRHTPDPPEIPQPSAPRMNIQEVFYLHDDYDDGDMNTHHSRRFREGDCSHWTPVRQTGVPQLV